jgi:hypothetical protein
MNRLICAVLAVIAMGAPAPLVQAAQEGDIIGQCLEDNADEGQTTEALSIYCSCANEKMMQDNYGRDIDISEWEKMNPDGQEACSKQAGWVSKPE